MCNYIHISRRICEVGGMKLLNAFTFYRRYHSIVSQRYRFWSQFYTALYFNANCVLFIYFRVMPFINHFCSIQLWYGDKKYNMEYNWVSNWREVCQSCLPSTLAGFVWDTICGMTMVLPFHCRDPVDALKSCMKEYLRKAWKFYPHYTNSVKHKNQAVKFKK
jgi:hypothetical protein